VFFAFIVEVLDPVNVCPESGVGDGEEGGEDVYKEVGRDFTSS
jgi:hypothetical protein